MFRLWISLRLVDLNSDKMFIHWSKKYAGNLTLGVCVFLISSISRDTNGKNKLWTLHLTFPWADLHFSPRFSLQLFDDYGRKVRDRQQCLFLEKLYSKIFIFLLCYFYPLFIYWVITHDLPYFSPPGACSRTQIAHIATPLFLVTGVCPWIARKN